MRENKAPDGRFGQRWRVLMCPLPSHLPAFSPAIIHPAAATTTGRPSRASGTTPPRGTQSVAGRRDGRVCGDGAEGLPGGASLDRSLKVLLPRAPLTSHCQVDPAAPICGALSVSLAQACSLSDTPGLTMRPQVERWPPTDSGLWLLGQVPGSAGPGASPSSLQASAIPPSWPLGSTHTRDVLFQDFTRGGWEVEKEYGRRRAPHAPAERTAEAGAGPALEAPGLDISRYRSI